MRHLLTLLVVLASYTTSYGAFVFSENFGIDGNNESLSKFTGFQNSAPITFSSILGADVRDSSASAGYTGASGGNNVFLTNIGEGFIASGIDTSGFSDMFVSFGGFEQVSGPVGFDSTMLTLEFSTDGATWNPLVFSSGDSNNWSTVQLATTTGAIPEATSLSLRFLSLTDSSLRIDDVSIQGISAVPEPNSFSLLALVASAGIFRRRRQS